MEEVIYKDFSTSQSLKFCDCGTTVICHTQSFVDITKRRGNGQTFISWVLTCECDICRLISVCFTAVKIANEDHYLCQP